MANPVRSDRSGGRQGSWCQPQNNFQLAGGKKNSPDDGDRRRRCGIRNQPTEGGRVMTTQQKLHAKALKQFRDLEGIIDDLKAAGPCKLDGNNAILNVRDWLNQLAGRCETI